MGEGSRHFDESSSVHLTLKRICKRLNELNIPYAIAGGMALFAHGFRKFTEDVGILVGRDDLKQIHQQLSGRGYVPLFTGSKNLRDTESGVRIEFLLTGDYPGDGKQKPVAFPRPSDVAELRDGVCFLNLPTLVELKLASGMTGADRMKDLADVQELIKLLSLPSDFGEQLSDYVQPKYLELWESTRPTGRRYIRIWSDKRIAGKVETVDEMIALIPESAETLTQMSIAGVTLDPHGGAEEDCVCLVTNDPEVAKRFDMHDESEFLGGD